MRIFCYYKINSILKQKKNQLFSFILQLATGFWNMWKNVAKFSVWPYFELWSLISRAEFYHIPLKMKSRLSVHWSFFSCDKNVIHVVCENSVANPEMKSFNSYVFVHQARHEFFIQMRKTTFSAQKQIVIVWTTVVNFRSVTN